MTLFLWVGKSQHSTLYLTGKQAMYLRKTFPEKLTASSEVQKMYGALCAMQSTKFQRLAVTTFFDWAIAMTTRFPEDAFVKRIG